MWLSRVIIKNFRNFKSLDVKLGEHAVVLGENKVGKTNLLFALRLILDPSLPDSLRRLRLDDFWDELPRPLTAEDVIEISVDFRGFENSENLLAVLADPGGGCRWTCSRHCVMQNPTSPVGRDLLCGRCWIAPPAPLMLRL